MYVDLLSLAQLAVAHVLKRLKVAYTAPSPLTFFFVFLQTVM